MAKPSRSEEAFSAEEKAAFQAQAEHFFESTAPKRSQKPPRSEVSESGEPSSFSPSEDVNDAERRHLEELNQTTEPVVPAGPAEVSSEDLDVYTPTGYYSTVSVGQKHCPTGEGFIQLGVKQAPPVNVSAGHHAHNMVHSNSLTNPARDDWKRPEQAVN